MEHGIGDLRRQDVDLSTYDSVPIATTSAGPEDAGTMPRFDVREEDFAAVVSDFRDDRIGVISLPLALKTRVDGGRASMGAQLGRLPGMNGPKDRGPVTCSCESGAASAVESETNGPEPLEA